MSKKGILKELQDSKEECNKLKDEIAMSKLYVIRVDTAKVYFSNSSASGKTILKMVGKTPTQNYKLFQKTCSGTILPIPQDEIIDFSHFRVEQFTTSKNDSVVLSATDFDHDFGSGGHAMKVIMNREGITHVCIPSLEELRFKSISSLLQKEGWLVRTSKDSLYVKVNISQRENLQSVEEAISSLHLVMSKLPFKVDIQPVEVTTSGWVDLRISDLEVKNTKVQSLKISTLLDNFEDRNDDVSDAMSDISNILALLQDNVVILKLRKTVTALNSSISKYTAAGDEISTAITELLREKT